MLKTHLPPNPYSLQSKGQRNLLPELGSGQPWHSCWFPRPSSPKAFSPEHSVLCTCSGHFPLALRPLLSIHPPRDEQLLPSFLKLLMMFAEGIDVLSVANLLYSSSMYSGGSTLADSCRGMSERFNVFKNSFFMFWSSVLKSTPSCSERISSKRGTSSSREECSKLRMGLQAARWTRRERTAQSWRMTESMASPEPPTALNELWLWCGLGGGFIRWAVSHRDDKFGSSCLETCDPSCLSPLPPPQNQVSVIGSRSPLWPPCLSYLGQWKLLTRFVAISPSPLP